MKGEQTLGLVCRVESADIVGGLQGANTIIIGTLQELGKGSEIDTSGTGLS